MLRLFLFGMVTCSLLSSCMYGSPNHPLSQKSDTFSHAFERVPDKILTDTGFQGCIAETVNSCSFQTGMEKVEAQNDEKLCDDLMSPDMKDQCQTIIVTQKAKSANDSTLCNTLSNPGKDACNLEISKTLAVRNNDINQCIILKDGEKDLAKINQQDSCILQMLSVQKSVKPSDCQKIQDPSLQKMCLSFPQEK